MIALKGEGVMCASVGVGVETSNAIWMSLLTWRMVAFSDC